MPKEWVCSTLQSPILTLLVDFDIPVDALYEAWGAYYPDSSTENTEADAEQAHVSKVEGYLKKAVHLSLPKEIVYGVEKNIKGSRSRRAERDPLPVIIFCIKYEVHRHNCGAHDDDDKYEIDKHHKAIDIVELVVPEWCEDEVHLDKNGPEW